jgi:hypothetical protein
LHVFLLLKPLDPELVGNPGVLLHVGSALLERAHLGVNPHVLLHDAHLLLVSLPLDALLVLLDVHHFQLLNLLFYQQFLLQVLLPLLQGLVPKFVLFLNVSVVFTHVLHIRLYILVYQRLVLHFLLKHLFLSLSLQLLEFFHFFLTFCHCMDEGV